MTTTDKTPNGIFLLDKPGGMTSHDVVMRVRKKLGLKAVGHSGTLDPLASGLMVMLIGQGTRFSPYLLSGDKGYEVKARFGVRSDTWDIDTKEEMIEDFDPGFEIDETKLKEAIGYFSGICDLQVPSFSAVKVNGRKLYEYARSGEEVPEVRREMNFKSADLLSASGREFKAALRVSKGTFVRSWTHAVGERLGSSAVVTELRRTYSSPYKVEQATSLETFMDADKPLESISFLEMPKALPHWPHYVVRGRWQNLISNGAIPNGMGWEIQRLVDTHPEASGVRILSGDDGHLLSLLVPNDQRNKVKVACVFK